MQHYYLVGGPALAPFKLQHYLDELLNRVPKIAGLQMQCCYWLVCQDLSSSPQPLPENVQGELLNADSLQRIETLLDAKISTAQSALGQFWILPRKGTISPWSSKAQDIITRIGLKQVQRLERGICCQIRCEEGQSLENREWDLISELFYDRLVQAFVREAKELNTWFLKPKGHNLSFIPVNSLKIGDYGLSAQGLTQLKAHYQHLARDPSDAECMMYASVNSEHCRHHIFNAHFSIDYETQPGSLFQNIQKTYEAHSEDVFSAYKDNAAIVAQRSARSIWPRAADQHYDSHNEPLALVIKAETHNHPTAIAAFQGAATGPGGEIRDEGATGRGAKPKAGLTGFSVSHLKVPGFTHDWEVQAGAPKNKVSALNIMLQGPLGAASFNNEFGRPNLCGYFRSFEAQLESGLWGYHKPVMLAGGMGVIRVSQFQKQHLPVGALVLVLGGPAFCIGLGGGALSSRVSSQDHSEEDYASVQRADPEMQKRAQEVINQCWALGRDNPILSIHDVGAGGLSNAIPELVYDSLRGAQIQLRAIPSADPSLSPLEIWCNESQERYVLAIEAQHLNEISFLAEREQCPLAVLGTVTEATQLQVFDETTNKNVIDMDLKFLFSKAEKMQRDAYRVDRPTLIFDRKDIVLEQACLRVLQHPSVGSKQFLITIGDRSVGGLSYRDQMVGPWQVPVADVAVTASDFYHHQGQAMAMGERGPVALIDPVASGRLALAEAITNIAAAPIAKLSDIKLSANWMAACDRKGEDAALWDTVKAVSAELCTRLGLTIPVGKDSLSMQTQWQEDDELKTQSSPLTLIVSAFAPVTDLRKSLTPELQITYEDSVLLLIDLGRGKNRLGGSILTEVYGQSTAVEISKDLSQEQRLSSNVLTPDLDNADDLEQFFAVIQTLNEHNQILAYHDRSDGGLFVTVLEMAFAAHTGLKIDLDPLGDDPLASLFSEELGAVLQIEKSKLNAVLEQLKKHHLFECSHILGSIAIDNVISFYHQGQKILEEHRAAWQTNWSELSYRMQALRDNPLCAQQEFERIAVLNDPGLYSSPSFDFNESIAAPYLNFGHKPKAAILREVGVNGHIEMAAAFMQAGFEAVDVCMSDIFSGRRRLDEFKLLAVCGGFSFADVLGAGRGWAEAILMNENVRTQFSEFFNRSDTLTLGVCNGCQMLAQLKSLIPGAEAWPLFKRNVSEQFEARVVMVEVAVSPAVFLQGMQGSRLPIVVSHGEGQTHWAKASDRHQALSALQYIDHQGNKTRDYPYNPNGSEQGGTAFSSRDGRALIMMPHPERCFRAWQCSWRAAEWLEATPWRRLFENARVWLG